MSAQGGLTRSDLVAQAMVNHPDLRVARYEIAKAEARHRGSGLLSNPEIATEMSHDDPLYGSDWQMSASLTLSQKFPLTGRLSLEKRVTSVQIQAAKAEVSNRERLVAGEVERLFVEVRSLSEQIGLANEQAALVSELAAFIGARHEEGEMSLAEFLQAKLEARTVKQSIASLRIERGEKLASLKRLIGSKAEVEIALEGTPDLGEVSSSLGEALGRRGDYRAAQLGIEIADHEIALERAKKWDDLTVGFTVANERMQDDPTGRGNDWFAGVGISIPLPWWNDNRHAVAEKQASRDQSAEIREGVIKRVHSELVAARAQVAAYRAMLGGELVETRELAEQNLAAQEGAYKTGQGQLLNVLRAREQVLKLEEAMLDARRNLALALVRLRTASGNNLP